MVAEAAGREELDSARIVSQRSRMLQTFSRNRTSLVGLVIIAILIIVAIAAPIIAPHDPIRQDIQNRLATPSLDHLFGQDVYGRDIFSRIIYGLRIALLVGVLSVALGGILGTALGTVAGYKGGHIETFLMRLVDVMLAFPALITGLLVMAVLGSGMTKLIIAIGLTFVPQFARMAHGATLATRESDYVLAAQAIGVRDLRMMRVHVLPNIMGDIAVFASLYIALAILLEASLSFIGLGISPPTPTWGQMISEGTIYLVDLPWFSIAPGLALLITIMAFNLVGDGLRDVFDPKSQD